MEAPNPIAETADFGSPMDLPFRMDAGDAASSVRGAKEACVDEAVYRLDLATVEAHSDLRWLV